MIREHLLKSQRMAGMSNSSFYLIMDSTTARAFKFFGTGLRNSKSMLLATGSAIISSYVQSMDICRQFYFGL
jgi:hypothetical protein